MLRSIAAALFFLTMSAMSIDAQGDITFTPDEAIVVRDALTELGKTAHPMAEEARGSAARVATGIDRRSFGVVMIALSHAAYEGTPACSMLQKMNPQAVCMK